MSLVTAFYAEHALWIWAGACAALLAIEVMTGSGWLLWASAAAGLTGILALAFDLPPATAVLVFALLTILSTLLARRYLPRSLAANDGDINDNLSRLIGQRAAVSQAFVSNVGRVFIDGKEWPAELEGGEEAPVGASVTVADIDGVRLRVRAL